MNKQQFLSKRVGVINPQHVRELTLYASHCGELYKEGLQNIHISQGKFYKKGEFDIMQAVKSYKWFVDVAAKKYQKQYDDIESGLDTKPRFIMMYCGDGFSSAERWAVAFELAESQLAEMEIGNFTEG